MSGAMEGWVRRGLRVALVVLCAVALAPATAHGAIVAGMTMAFPTSVSVGQTGLPAWIALRNLNTVPDDAGTNTVCNAGDTSPPCSANEPGITVVPSCKQLVLLACTGADPGVLVVSATATGRAGTACAGVPFTTSVVDPAFGTVLFTPQPARTHVTLAANGAGCTIDFTVDVAKSPTGDVEPAAAGVQTGQAASHTQWRGPIGGSTTRSVGSAALGATSVAAAGPTTQPPCNDCDDDGFLARVDCGDNSPDVHPGAIDRPGNLFDEDCDGRDESFPRLDTAVAYSYRFFERFTRFDSLVLRPARANSTVRVRCTGRGCPFASTTRRIKQNHAKVDLSAIVRRARLRPKAKLEVRVTKPGTIGVQRTLTVRANKRPTENDRCLTPGASTPSACPL